MPTQRIAVRIPTGLLLLDKYPNAAVAYSLRKLRKTYTGDCIRVRRSSDNTEQNIGFIGNDLDTQTMLDFVGYNLFTYSEDMWNVAWVKTQLNTTTQPYSNVTTAPDGTLTADKIIENTASTTTHYVTRTAQGSMTYLANYNLSVYLKAGERTKVVISSNIPNVSNPHSCTVDLTNGTISNNTFTNTPIMESVGNGWYRFSVRMVSAVTASSLPLRIQLLNELDQVTYTGDGTSGCFMWGAQLSKTSDLKPYTRTFADATRSAFVTTWYDQSENAKNVTQATAANQPRIVNAGSLDLVNGKVAVLGDGVNDTLINSTLSLTNPSSIFTVVDKVGTSGNFGLTIGGSIASQFLLSSTGYSFYQNGPSFGPQYSNNNQSLLVAKTSTTGTDWELYGNNTTVANDGQNIGNFLGAHLSLFDRGGTTSRANMYMQEYIIWSSNQMANRLPIQSNINSHYNIY